MSEKMEVCEDFADNSESTDNKSQTESKMEDNNSDENSDSDDDSSSTKEDSKKESKDSISSTEDSEDDEIDAQTQEEINYLKNALTENPYNYDAHKLLIEKYQQIGELELLRAAREDMSSKYPLTPELWLAWLRDEMNLASSSESSEVKLSILEICDRAVNDYLSVEVWLEYLQFSTGLGIESKENVNKIRNIFERALTAAGLHVSQGALIWDAYREFEIFLASMIDANEKQEQINKIGKLYRRQLSCPLEHMEKTFEEYELWRCGEGSECNEDPKLITEGYQKALAMLKERSPFEEKLCLCQSKDEELHTYKIYLKFEKEKGDPGRVTVLFERAITDHSLEPTIWIDYIDYLQEHLKIDEIIEKIYERAFRNVPWSVKIWQKCIRYSEKKNKTLSEMQGLMERAFGMGFNSSEDYKNLWMSYLEYLRRYVDKSENEAKDLKILQNNFNKACDHLATFGIEGDPSCDILQFWASVEAIYAGDMEKARSLWSDIMSQGHSESASSWLEFISLERTYGDSKHVRKIFQKALTATKDWPESIATAWLKFERSKGTLEQIEICEEKVEERLKQVNDEREKAEKYSSIYEQPSTSKKPTKRKLDDGGKWQKLGPSNTKVSKFDKTPKETSTQKNIHKKVAPPPGYKETDEKKSEQPTQEVDDKISVFISNLDYTVTEEEVREALKPAGLITLFKMVCDYSGRSKGFCYVQLSSPEAVELALSLDRTRINGRPMFVSKCDPSRSYKTGFKYNTGLEKNKLFVKGLPVTKTKEQIEEIFKIYGNLKEVRLVTYRNGHSKGLAYVEYENEQDASKALLATDGMTVEDKIISVAVSQPPERKKTPAEDSTTAVRSLGGSSSSRTTFGNPKTVLSMVPRTVRATPSNSGSSSSNAPKNGVSKPMSNDDFRSMLLNKK